MKIGIFSFNTVDSLPPDALAREVESRGFESLWFPEHTHIPAPEDGSDVVRDAVGGVLAHEYRHMSDPFTALAAAAAVTTRLRLGTSICLVNQHHPINLAKSVATLDHLSRGRFVFGVGAGWNKVEMAHHGIRFEDRWAQLIERLEAMKTIWREERPSFEGRFVRFSPLWQWPKPLQAPNPPIVLGTLDTPFGRAQVARHADGWLPLTFDVARTRQSIADVHARMRAIDRDPGALEVSLFFLADRTQDVAVLHAARETGAARAIMRMPAVDTTALLRRLDAYASHLERLA